MLEMQAHIEYQLELAKEKLVRECKDFNTIDAFRIMDRDGKSRVEPNELIKALNEIGAVYTQEEVVMFF